MTELVTNYLACWNETDAEARRRAFARLCTLPGDGVQ
jgi:hypothetical protein